MEDNYYKTKESVQEYIELAKDVNGQELIDKLMLVLPKKSNLLEIGSGPGSDWKILNDFYNVVGSDNSDEFLNHLNEKYPQGDFLILDAITLETDNFFDGIYSNKVMIHLNDSELQDSVKRQYEVLNPDGIVCHSFWKGEGSEIFKGLSVNYYNEEKLTSFFEIYFEILSLTIYNEFEDGDSILLIGKRK